MTPLGPADRPELPLEVRLGGFPELGGLEVTEWIDEGPWDEAGDPLLALPTKGMPENTVKSRKCLVIQRLGNTVAISTNTRFDKLFTYLMYGSRLWQKEVCWIYIPSYQWRLACRLYSVLQGLDQVLFHNWTGDPSGKDWEVDTGTCFQAQTASPCKHCYLWVCCCL